jgi:putative copper resistance protein D
MEFTVPQVAATALFNVSFAWIVGALASRYWVMKQTAVWQGAVVKRLSSAMLAGLMACTVGVFFSLWTESAMMGDVAWLDARPAFVQTVTATYYGHVGVAVLALLAVAIAAHLLFNRPGANKAYSRSIAALVLLLAAARVTVGHAFEHGPFSLAVAVEWLHLLFMALWAGIVFIAAWVVLPRVRDSEVVATGERAAYLTSMSNWAAVAVAGILATGIYNAYRVLGSPRELIDAVYGNVLVFKLAMVLLAIALGGFNKFVGLPAALSTMPSANTRSGLGTVVMALRMESIALLLVLMAAAVLTSSAPPGQ